MAVAPQLGCDLTGRDLIRGFLCLLLSVALAPSLAAADHFVILGGLGGEPAFATLFNKQAVELRDLCRTTAGDDSQVHLLYGNDARRENVKTLMEQLAKQAHPDDNLVVFLIGHGSFDGMDYKFNLPGPDITAGQLANWLDAIPARQQLVVNTTSASGGSLEPLKSKQRAVITATKSGREITITVFAEFFLEAMQDTGADTDKDDVVTALEAFRYAEQKVKEFYETEKRLATEHPLVEGETAQNFTLARFGSAQQAAANPATRELLAERDKLQAQVADLRRRKDDLPPQEYESQLEKLLIALATAQARIDSTLEDKLKLEPVKE
jgi:hypothetical protein